MEIQKDGNVLRYVKKLSSSRMVDGKDVADIVRLEANKIRMERTGIHATVRIVLNTTVMAWSGINIEDDPQRVRLANSAYSQMTTRDDVKQAFSKEALKHEFDIFCMNLWPKWTEATSEIEVAGHDVVVPLVFLLMKWVIDGGGTILFGEPGAGKSYTALLMAVSMDAGCKALYPLVTQTRVLYINLERSEKGLQHRLGLVNRALGLPPSRTLLVMNERGKSLMDIHGKVETAIKKYGVGCIFLDSVSRSGFGDLNDNKPANAIMDALNDFGVTWVAIAHSPRSDTSHVFGSQMFDAAADLVVQQDTERKDGENDRGIALTVVKANDAPWSPTKLYTYEFDEEIGLTAARPARDSEWSQLSENSKTFTLEDDIKEYLLSHGLSTVVEISDFLKKERSTIQRTLTRSAQFATYRKAGKENLWAVATTVSVAPSSKTTTPWAPTPAMAAAEEEATPF